ncbi:MAG TPA: FGGY family carbohydrate kinase [Puia sp.]|nr:FGGY family carbohydrate kinase [Puia sp.]
MKSNVIAIADIGKTNKKVFLFDEQYKMVWEQSEVCEQTIDEDGEPCEDLTRLTRWLHASLAKLAGLEEFTVKAINFSAYGASFVYIGQDNQPIAPLYNYLKAYPEELKKKFYATYGGEITFSMLTASPVLGSLNSGMQLYRLKHDQPDLFEKVRYALHLPQFLSFLLTGRPVSDITSIGCHTNLWNFSQQHYHEWVYREGIIDKLAPIMPSTSVLPTRAATISRAGANDIPSDAVPIAGVGLHDSSAAMIPYLESFREPFVLISTGTWCISMNPFNSSPLTAAELQKDCLCYMSFQGRPVKASRLFAGYEHEQQVQRLAAHFHTAPARAANVHFDPECVARLRSSNETANDNDDITPVTASVFHQRELKSFANFEEAYHQLMLDIMDQQIISTRLVLHDTDVRRIFVDGGFGRNQLYMHLLAEAFPGVEVFTASIPQATAMGAALAIHRHWNSHPLPGDIIELKYYK